MPLQAGSRIGHYTIISALGRGGVGEVYLAEDGRLQRRVALKILNAKFAGDENARARFLREARMAAALDHPNICTLHEIGSHEGFDYLVMQALEGETLAARLERGRLAPNEALEVAVELAAALAYAHGRGVIHRDIKPQNVMLTPRLKLMDFGLAKAPGRLDDQQETQTSLTRDGVFFGTIPYMSPEQLEGAPADQRSDVFSLGVTLYELFAGRHPFAAATSAATITAIASKPAPSLSTVAPDAPRSLTPILAKALAANRENRYPSASELLADLEAVRRGDAAAMTGRRVGVSRWIWLTAAAVSLAVVAWIMSAQMTGRPETPEAPVPRATPPPLPAPEFATWFEIQPPDLRRADQWRDSVGADVVPVNSKLRIHVIPNARGSLYIVSDERPLTGAAAELTLLYPTSDLSGVVDGALTTEPFVVGGPAADADVWIVWARGTVPELEAVKPLANAVNRGVVRDSGTAASIRRLLQQAKGRSTATVDTTLKRVSVRSTSDMAAYPFALAQR